MMEKIPAIKEGGYGRDGDKRQHGSKIGSKLILLLFFHLFQLTSGLIPHLLSTALVHAVELLHFLPDLQIIKINLFDKAVAVKPGLRMALKFADIGIQPYWSFQISCLRASSLKRYRKAASMLHTCPTGAVHLFTIKQQMFLFAQNNFCQFHRVYDSAVFINTHISAGDFVDENDFVLIVAEFKFDVIQIQTFFCQIFCYNLSNFQCLCFHVVKHFLGHNAQSSQTFGSYQWI